MHTALRQPALAVLPAALAARGIPAAGYAARRDAMIARVRPAAERNTDIGIRSAPRERAEVEAERARRGR
jgi:hypothetical protein